MIDGVPRLSGPSHHTPAALWPVVLCIQYKVQHSTSTQAGTPQLPKMSPFQGCELARPYCTVLRTPSPSASSTFLEPRQCFIPRDKHRESSPRIIIAQDYAHTVKNSSYLKVKPLMLALLLGLPKAWCHYSVTLVLLAPVRAVGGCRLPFPSRAYPCPSRFLLVPFLARPLRHSHSAPTTARLFLFSANHRKSACGTMHSFALQRPESLSSPCL